MTTWIALALAFLALPAAAHASEPLWALLKAGGQVVLIRHAITTPGVGDPAGMRLDDCASQRNLTDAGRAHARRVGEAFRARGIEVDRLLTSPWCRCIETARLAWGSARLSAEVWTPLGNLFGRPERQAEQVREMRARVSERRARGNLVLVTPQGDGRFTVAGRLGVP
jgi:phosphohistidine phosphatase SixA